MFFYASKIIWALLSPLNFVYALFGLGVVLRFFARKLSIFVIGAAISLFMIFGILPVGYNMLVYLETAYEEPVLPEKVDGILVLGGFFDIRISESRGVPALNSNGDRLTAAAALAKKYPDAMLVFSGGNGFMVGGHERTEAQDVEAFLMALEFPLQSVTFEEDSRNTYENITFSRDYIRPKRSETWLLVTSAYHMKRAVAVAQSASWALTPVPVDYRTDGKYRLFLRSFNVTGRFYELELALKEVVGLIAYRITGKISLPK